MRFWSVASSRFAAIRLVIVPGSQESESKRNGEYARCCREVFGAWMVNAPRAIVQLGVCVSLSGLSRNESLSRHSAINQSEIRSSQALVLARCVCDRGEKRADWTEV